MTHKPSIYNLGTEPRIVLATVDIDGDQILPTEARLTVDSPDGTSFTVSGGAMTQSGFDLIYQFQPDVTGFWYYEGWIRDTDGREAAKSQGFYVTDRIVG